MGEEKETITVDPEQSDEFPEKIVFPLRNFMNIRDSKLQEVHKMKAWICNLAHIHMHMQAQAEMNETVGLAYLTINGSTLENYLLQTDERCYRNAKFDDGRPCTPENLIAANNGQWGLTHSW